MSPVTAEALARALREEAEHCIAGGQPERAAAILSEIWRVEAASAAAAFFVVSGFERIRGALELQPYRLAIARSATFEPVVPLLRAAAFVAGLDLTVHVGDFNSYVQELVDASSALYGFQPDAVILAVESRDTTPRLWRDWADLAASEAKDEIRSAVERFRGLLTAFRKHSRASLIVHSLATPEALSRGVLDAQLEVSQAEAFEAINHELRKIARDHRGVYLLDYDALLARHGRANWRDEKKWLTVRMPFAATHVSTMAREWMRFVHPLSGRVAKAVAVDLDNTLWGGVIGEDGFDGIKLGNDYPGAAYREVQRALLDLRQRGILLAVCSKNNAADAMEVLERHPEMLLRSQHFASLRINWNDKSTNLREIAAELKIGTDAIALLDDNPVERQQVRAVVPEVMVIDLPDDPLRFAHAIRNAAVFERLTFSSEDLQRGELYRADGERQKLETVAGTREDFYRSLEQEVELGRVSASTMARVAQLTQKTNQFNLTTRRYTEPQIAAMAESEQWRVYWIRVRDRFSDNGLVGVAVLHTDRPVWEIDAFLLSCRIIGRTVETAFLALLLDEVAAARAQAVEGWFLPTKKNSPAEDFYPSHGFRIAEKTDRGARWVLELPQQTVRVPDWIRVAAKRLEIRK